MNDDEFKKIVAEGIDSLPEWVLRKIDNIAFLVEDLPTVEQRMAHGLSESESLFGLYEGVPLADRGNAPVDFPDKITIFKKPILDTYGSVEDIKACVRNTVWHEVGHHFGHDEQWIAAEELRRGKTM